MLNPPVTLLVKLVSIVVHADELTGVGGHRFDISALRALVDDPEVKAWVAEMTKAAFAPVKRLTPAAEAAVKEIRRK